MGFFPSLKDTFLWSKLWVQPDVLQGALVVDAGPPVPFRVAAHTLVVPPSRPIDFGDNLVDPLFSCGLVRGDDNVGER